MKKEVRVCEHSTVLFLVASNTCVAPTISPPAKGVTSNLPSVSSPMRWHMAAAEP